MYPFYGNENKYKKDSFFLFVLIKKREKKEMASKNEAGVDTKHVFILTWPYFTIHHLLQR